MADKVPSNSRNKTDWDIGDVILDLYEVQGKTSGGMGTVYFVWHKNWRTKLAIKSPRPDLVSDEQANKRFIREAETWVDLGLHPYIASCYYVRGIEGLPRIFIEYVDGGDLAGWIKQGRVKDWQTILDLAIQFCDGMAYAHSKGLIHRDIKPANCLMTQDGTLKITDFGIVKVASPDIISEPGQGPVKVSGGTITVHAGGMGTPHYMAPEQWHQAKTVGPEADIYSFGVMLYEMCCGRRPFDLEPGEPTEGLHAKHLVSDPPDPREFRTDLPGPLRHLILNCLEKKPEHRYPSFAEARERLEGIYRQMYSDTYPRKKPEAIKLKADSLNNKGVSLNDLGNKNQAHKCFKEALYADPQHFEANINLCILDWRQSQITDEDFIVRLRGFFDSNRRHWRSEEHRIFGEVHICRGDLERAEEYLKKALEINPECEISKRLLRKVRKGIDEEYGWARKVKIFKGHTGSVDSVAISPDGKFALSGSRDATLRVWDMTTGQSLRILIGHSKSVYSVAISPDGRFALSGGEDATLRVWDLATGQCLRIFEGHTKGVISVAISPKGNLGLSWSVDETLRLWDLTSSQSLMTFEEHIAFSGFNSVAISPDGRFAISGGADATLRVWDLATGQCLNNFTGHTGGIDSVAISPDGKFALSGSRDTTLRLWDLTTGQSLRIFRGHRAHGVISVSISPNCKFGLSGGGDRTLRLWDLASGQCISTFFGHSSGVYCVAISPDGRFGLSASGDKTLCLWSLATDQLLKFHHMHFLLSKPSSVKELADKEDEFQLLIAKAKEHFDKQNINQAALLLQKARKLPGYERDQELLQLWSYASKKITRISLEDGWEKGVLEGHTEAVYSVAISPDGRFCLSGSGDKTLRLWDLASGQCLRTFYGHTEVVNCVAICPDGRSGLSGSVDGTVRIWDLATGRCLKIFELHTDDSVGVACFAITPDGNFGLSSGATTICFWDLVTGQCLWTSEGNDDDDFSADSLAISSDGKFAISVSEIEDVLRLWDLTTGKCLSIHERNDDPIYSASISPDSKFILSAHSKTLRLWDLVSGKCLKTFRGPLDIIHCITIFPDGRFALSGGDATLRIWDLSTGRCLRGFFIGRGRRITSIAISPDGRFCLSVCIINETIRLWEFIWGLNIKDKTHNHNSDINGAI